MSYHDRRRKVAVGVSFIEEAIADGLREAEAEGRVGLTRPQIMELIGFPESDESWYAIRYFLGQMASAGEVVNDHPNPGPDRWRLN